MLIRLNEEDKGKYCVKLGYHLKRLRSIVGYTQDDLAILSGISKERISRIENEAFVMKWSHFVSFLMVFSMNSNTKEYMVAAKIITPRLLQALQMKDDQIPPDISVPINESLANEFYADFRILNSFYSDHDDEIKRNSQ